VRICYQLQGDCKMDAAGQDRRQACRGEAAGASHAPRMHCTCSSALARAPHQGHAGLAHLGVSCGPARMCSCAHVAPCGTCACGEASWSEHYLRARLAGFKSRHGPM